MMRVSLALAAATMLLSCGGGGGTGNPQDSGTNKTTLTVEASEMNTVEREAQARSVDDIEMDE